MQIIGAFTGVVAPTWGQPHAHDEVVHVQPADVPTAERGGHTDHGVIYESSIS